jgi:hypothetical protein
MKPTSELADSIFIEKVKRARREPIDSKMISGAQLFDYACEMSRSGIRAQNPLADAAQVEAELRRRLKLMERLEDRR